MVLVLLTCCWNRPLRLRPRVVQCAADACIQSMDSCAC